MLANRGLIASLIRREVLGRYKGSALGLLWSILNPIVMLGVYTFVFSDVFKSQWIGGRGTRAEFALVLFAGLMVFNAFSECIARAPSLILGNANYVKKVVFPLEVLPVVVLGSAAFHLLVSFVVWAGFHVLALGMPAATVALVPIVLAPLVLMILGISWGLAALGVFVRDVAQVVGLLLMMLMFLSPVFYQVDALPEAYRAFLYVSPVTVAIEQVREVMMWGRAPAWGEWLAYTGASASVALLGFLFFQKTRRGFADVL
jgi:lipopolysaccharide transport system permease protein